MPLKVDVLNRIAGQNENIKLDIGEKLVFTWLKIVYN